MNKGLEVIEAHHLFDVPMDHISVLLHPQSIVHSMVEYVDGSVMAQLATADMALPVQYALTYPVRKPGVQEFLDLTAIQTLAFSRVDPRRFPCLDLARQAARSSEAHVIAMNAANEEAVAAFLEGLVPFGQIHRAIAKTLDRVVPGSPSGLEEVLALDGESRRMAQRELSVARGSQ